MRAFAVGLVVALSSFTHASLPRNPVYKVKEEVHPPRGWIKQAPAPGDQIIQLRIGLPQPNFPLLEQHLYEVSDPYHERYGMHLSKEEVEELVAPHPESLDIVNGWLASHGIMDDDINRSPARDWITITVPISLAEKLLDTSYHVWHEPASGDTVIRTTSYSLPTTLHTHIDVIQPTTMFARWKGMKSTLHREDDTQVNNIAHTSGSVFNVATGTTVDASCNTTITIKCLQQLYNAVGYIPKATKINSIGVTGYLEQFANFADLQIFYAEQRPEALNTSFKVVSVKGGLNSQNTTEAGDEANLDVQFAFGLSFPTPGTFYSTAGRPPFDPDLDTPTNTNEPYTDWLDFVLSHPSPPRTISTSYGDDEQTVPESFARRACASFAQLGARGVSLTFSSGDGGVGDGNPDPTSQTCLTNDSRNITRFMPLFPASCPFVTGVGGTNNVPEVAVSFSGGGFSNYFSRPSYQEEAVTKFLKNLPRGTYEGLFNRSGRGIPDVSAEARRFRIILSGQPVSIGGTSAASPTFAGIVALLNDARLAQGLPSLGFLNPLLYTKGLHGLNDITAGNNPGCGTQGWNATKGWDPITGLGTPNFGRLKDLIT